MIVDVPFIDTPSFTTFGFSLRGGARRLRSVNGSFLRVANITNQLSFTVRTGGRFVRNDLFSSLPVSSRYSGPFAFTFWLCNPGGQALYAGPLLVTADALVSDVFIQQNSTSVGAQFYFNLQFDFED